jgi:hypothetical protein
MGLRGSLEVISQCLESLVPMSLECACLCDVLSQSHKEGLQTDHTEIVSRGLAMFLLNTPIWHYDARHRTSR